MTPANFEQFLPRLSEFGVDYILIGGGAATAHGSARATYDVDIVYSRRPENHLKLVAAIADLQPYYRGAPAGLPFRWDAEMLAADLNFTLTTNWGDIDLLGEVAGNGTYESLRDHVDTLELYGQWVCVMSMKP